MRIFVFLLILANLLFFAWTRDYFGLSREPDAYRVNQELLAERVRIVSNDEPPPESARAEKPGKSLERPPAEACVLLADVPLAEAEPLEKMLAEKLPAFRTARTTTAGNSSHWVYIPPLKTKREAENKVAELKKFGIKEFFIVQENGPNNLAISLGLFSTPEAAESALEALREKGVRSAKVMERSIRPALAQLEVRGPEAQSGEMNQLLGEALPEAKRNPCKSKNASGQ